MITHKHLWPEVRSQQIAIQSAPEICLLGGWGEDGDAEARAGTVLPEVTCRGVWHQEPALCRVPKACEWGFTVDEEETQLSHVAVGTEAFLRHRDFHPQEERDGGHTSWGGFDFNDTIHEKEVLTGQYDLPGGLF